MSVTQVIYQGVKPRTLVFIAKNLTDSLANVVLMNNNPFKERIFLNKFEVLNLVVLNVK